MAAKVDRRRPRARRRLALAPIGLLLACAPVYDPSGGADATEGSGGSDGSGDSGGSGGSGGGVSPDPSVFNDDQWAQLLTHAAPEEIPDDPSNDYDLDDAAADLGQKLFFDTGYSGSRTDVDDKKGISCADVDCHDPTQWFQAVTTEASMGFPWRNAPTLVNTGFYEWYAWDGSHDSLWSQSLFPPEGPMHSDRVSVVHRMLSAYGEEYEDIFGDAKLPLDAAVFDTPATPIPPPILPPGVEADPYAATEAWDALNDDTHTKINRAYANFGKALAAYQRRLVSRDSPFDRYLAGNTDAISEPAKNGLFLFEFVLPCGECHSGPGFSDNDFHNIGTGDDTDNQRGRREGVVKWRADVFTVLSDFSDGQPEDFEAPVESSDDDGKFRTKHLRQVAETGRYMHDGLKADLPAVLSHYADAGNSTAYFGELDDRVRAINDDGLSPQERDDIIAFLATLTGEPVDPALTQDTSTPPP